ncbi:MAG: hydroxymethylglutaryl-CoA lyase [Acidimicrobiaceae bacterium]|nr:hydroxymethylglutaryl-CoA lyase [Acidimicrobiia bacterium]MCY4494496.1 hydroxymethylglutaryl-CoA lyase [Acidimicrobiaceae bacterium]
MLGGVTECIQIVEVAPRDGLQADPADLSTAQKVELIERLIAAGHSRIEAASFVNPAAVPKMADGDAVMAAAPRNSGVSYSALALNERGVQRAVAAGVDEVCGVVVATETFSQANQRATIAESIQRWRTISDTARAAGTKTVVTVSAVCGCPYEGRVDPGRVLDIVSELADTQPDELALADTIGAGVPTQVGALFAGAAQRAPGVALRGHFHNTRNTALANVAAAIDVGVRIFDSSLGGVGGCPFAPRATGNVATEDVVYLLHEMGYDTGLDLDALIDASTWLETQLGHGVPSLVAKAGGFPQPR